MQNTVCKIQRVYSRQYAEGKKNYILSVACAILSIACCLLPAAYCFSQVTFQQTFVAPYMNGGVYVETTSDGGFIVTGQHESGAECDAYVFRRDGCGNLVWFKTYGGADSTDSEGGTCIRQTSDGGFIISGLGFNSPDVSRDAFLLKIDAGGNAQWVKSFGGGPGDYGLFVQQTNDGGYILLGNTTSFGAGDWDVYLIKTNASGNMQWSRTFGGTGRDFSNVVEQTSDDGYIIFGSTNSFGSGGYDIWLIKTDSSGNLQWNRTIGGAGDEGTTWMTKGQITSDGGYIIESYTTSFGAGSSDVLLVKTDNNGFVQWARAYGDAGVDQGRFVSQTTDGGYIITGFTGVITGANPPTGNADYFLIKTDSSGNVAWANKYGGANEEKSMCVKQANDGGYVMSGNTGSFGSNFFDAYFVKTDSAGNVGCNQTTWAPTVTNGTLLTTTPAPTTTSPTVENTPSLIVNDYTPTPNMLCLSCSGSFFSSSLAYCNNGLFVTYTDSSVCATSWQWDFENDGIIDDTVQNPVHAFPAPGTYDTKLIIANVIYGCADTLILPVTVSGIPNCQCLTKTAVNFNSWIEEGDPANGDWVVGGVGGSQVTQQINTPAPTFYVSPDTFINVIIDGTITVNEVGVDDDLIGFVFGYNEPVGNSTNYDCWLFDWKQGTQAAGGYTAQEGFTLTKVNGVVTDVWQY
ncbi:MAG: hypothetical protein FVQ77_17395, partial [Cytophagales bacterium]|nr:hypothetical protein [Cytophagales bacterium]